MDYRENVAGPELADEFYAELQFYFEKAADSPESYSARERDLRRVNLKRFPCHFLFRIVDIIDSNWPQGDEAGHDLLFQDL